MWNWDDGHMDDGWGVVMLLGMVGVWVALIAVIVLAVVWAVRSTTRTPWMGPAPQQDEAAGSVGAPTRGAERILGERLARGEIDTEEYWRRLDALTSRNQS